MRSLLVLIGFVALIGLLVSRNCNQDCPRACFDPRPGERVLEAGLPFDLGRERGAVGFAHWGRIELELFARQGAGRYLTVRRGSTFEAGGSAWRVNAVESGSYGGAVVERIGPCTTPIGCDEAPRSRSPGR